MRCKGCDRVHDITLQPYEASNAWVPDSKEEWQRLATFEIRGMDPTDAEVRDGFDVQAVDGTKYEDGLCPTLSSVRACGFAMPLVLREREEFIEHLFIALVLVDDYTDLWSVPCLTRRAFLAGSGPIGRVDGCRQQGHPGVRQFLQVQVRCPQGREEEEGVVSRG